MSPNNMKLLRNALNKCNKLTVLKSDYKVVCKKCYKKLVFFQKFIEKNINIGLYLHP
jgi:hypothetical protein